VDPLTALPAPTAQAQPRDDRDYQLEVGQVEGSGLYEVLAQQANGHRTVRRVNAEDHEAAVEALGDLGEGVRVLKSTPAGAGLGSGDLA
jgi:hypothetical protein